MRRVVSNTGPLLHLSEAQALALLELTGEVCIPETVDEEMSRHQPNWSSEKPMRVQVIPLVSPYDAQAEDWLQAGLLDAGEAQAIALVRQPAADWFLTDDAAARLLAASLGIEVHGSLGIVLWAAAAGHLTYEEAQLTLDRLAASSLWLSRRVLAEAKAALDKMFS